MNSGVIPLSVALAVMVTAASAQAPGDPRAVRPSAPVTIGDPAQPAKEYFGRVGAAAPGRAEVIGFYSKGCLQGAVELPADGANWQVMRPSRNRAWGHPVLVDFIRRKARDVPAATGWPGLLVGDLSQPRGGPMLTGHASHQSGLDADIWLTPMPDRRLTREERETMLATDMVRPDRLDVSESWTPSHQALIRLLAEEATVERLFVNAAIKQALCRTAGNDRAWLAKVRPMWGHNYHVHVRLGCPPGSPDCAPQEPPPKSDGCDASLAWWFTEEVLRPKPGKPAPPMKLSELPAACRAVLTR